MFLSIESQFYTFCEDANNRANIVIEEAYHKSRNKEHITIQTIGIWSNTSGLTMTTESFWERRKNLDGIELTGATAEVSVQYLQCLK